MKTSNNRKRVAMITVHSDPLAKLGGHETGGQNVYVSELSKHLAQMGWSVDIFTRLTRKRKKMVRSYGKNINVIYLKAGPRYHISKRKVFEELPEFVGNFLTFKQENKLHYNIIHGNYYLGGWAASQIKRILRVPMVETFHSLGYVRYHTLEKFRKEDINTEESQERIRAEKEIMKAADRIIATNVPEEKDILQYYDFDLENKIKVIPCGVNLKRFRKINLENARGYTNSSPKDKIIVFVGRIDWRKGIETMIRSFPLVLKKLPEFNENFKMVIIGGKKSDAADNQEIRRLKNIAKELEVEDKVLFLGRKNQEKLRYYYSSGDVCVIPSLYEPFGLTSLEAMRCGVPLIVSDVGGLSYVVQNRETGLVFPPGNEKVLANKIVELLKKKRLRNKLTKKAEETVKENYSWKKVSCEMAKLYQELI